MRRFSFQSFLTAAALTGAASSASAAIFEEHFNTGFFSAPGVPPAGWLVTNNSQPIGAESWQEGSPGDFPALLGGPDEYAFVFYLSGADTATLSNWLITPQMSVPAGGQVSFYTATGFGSTFPDRLELRSSVGSGTNVGTTATSVGTFTNLLLSVNANLDQGGYPEFWAQQTYTFPAAFDGRLAFRYFVTEGGPNGANSNILGVDEFTVSATPVANIVKDIATKEDNTGGPVYNRPVADGSGLSAIGTAVAYVVKEFDVPAEGGFRFSVTPTGDSTIDAFLAFYAGAFDPANPLETYFGGADNTFDSEAEIVDATLPAGKYFLVVSGYDNATEEFGAGAFDIRIQGAFTLPSTAIPGDYNGDGAVNSADYTVWADNFGTTGPGVPGDGNGDGVVNSADYTIWADNFGSSGPGTVSGAVPEPSAFAGMMALGLPLIGRRRR